MTVAEFHLAGQHNQATHGGGSPLGAVANRLKSGGTISLGSGETLARSDLVQQRGGGGALLAAVDSSDGARRVRLGVIGDESGVSKWRAANKGATAELSPAQTRALADGLTDSSRKARQQHAEADAVIEVLEDTGWDPDNPDLDSTQRDLLDRHDALTSGLVGNQQTISTPWGDVVYGTRVTDGGPSVALAVVSDDADADWTLDDAISDGTALDLTLAQVRALSSKLRTSAGSGQTAAAESFAFDESNVKRDREGKFASIAERVNAVISSFKPQRIGSNKEATAYLKANKPKLTNTQAGAVDRYTGDGFLELNKKMRAGDTADPEVKRIDAAMRPLPDDLVVTRRVDLSALGVENGEQLEALRGQRYTDDAYMSTSLGSPYGGDLGGVTLRIAAPKGTPAVLAAELSRNPSEREVLLGRGLQLVITSVKANDKFGYDVSAVIVPKEG